MNPYSGRNAPLLKNVRGGRAPVSTSGHAAVGRGLGGHPKLSEVDRIFRRAALDLNFAKTKTLDGRITFTRASGGTYFDENGVMQTAADHVPRFDHDPVTRESLGLLVEESRTNLLLRTSTISTALGWNAAYAEGASSATSGGTGSVAVVTPNYATAPDGTQTASRVQLALNGGTTSGDRSGINQGLNVDFGPTANAQSFASSFYFKILDDTTLAQIQNNLIWFGTLLASNTFVSNKITPAGGGWYRCDRISTHPFTGSANVTFRFQIIGTQGRDSLDILIWGAQLEVGAFPTSYIPTTTAQVTRAADLIEMTGTDFSGWYRQDEGTVFADVFKRDTATGYRQIASIDDNTLNNRVSLSVNGGFGHRPRVDILTGNVSQFQDVYISFLDGSAAQAKLVAAFAKDDVAAVFNGGTPSKKTGGVALPTVTQLFIGNRGGNPSYLSAHIKRLTYWPTRLPNATLQSLTA